MAKMTTKQKLEQAIAMVEKYRAELAAEEIRNNIEAGDRIVFTWGRGETKQTLEGVIVGIKDDNNGRWVAVTHGEGFDLERKTVRVADIVTNFTADARIAAKNDPLLTEPTNDEVVPLPAKDARRGARHPEADDPLAAE